MIEGEKRERQWLGVREVKRKRASGREEIKRGERKALEDKDVERSW